MSTTAGANSSFGIPASELELIDAELQPTREVGCPRSKHQGSSLITYPLSQPSPQEGPTIPPSRVWCDKGVVLQTHRRRKYPLRIQHPPFFLLHPLPRAETFYAFLPLSALLWCNKHRMLVRTRADVCVCWCMCENVLMAMKCWGIRRMNKRLLDGRVAVRFAYLRW